MEHIIILILTCLFIFASTWLFEGKQDYYMIKDSKGNQKFWKLFGNFYAGSFLALCAIAVTYITQSHSLLSILLLVIYLLVWNIAHDMSIGYYLTKNVFHLGSTGWDAKITKIFQNGKIWLFARLLWLFIATGFYFGLCR